MTFVMKESEGVMITVQERAEEKLVKTLQLAKTADDQTCCLHVTGAALKNHHFLHLPFFIGQWLGDPDEGLILICHDRDIFVFSKFLTLEIFMKFRDRLYGHFELEESDNNGLVSFYDFKISGAGIIQLAQAKLEKEEARQKAEDKKAKALEKEKNKTDILSAPLNMELVRTLGSRRKKHEHPHILVIEDDPFSRKLIGMSLTPGYSIFFAGNGQEAIDQYLLHAPDIVFLDIDLPDISGHDVLRKITETDASAYIVMLSGNSQLENISQSVDAGAKGFVGKPFAREKLIHHITKGFKS